MSQHVVRRTRHYRDENLSNKFIIYFMENLQRFKNNFSCQSLSVSANLTGDYGKQM